MKGAILDVYPEGCDAFRACVLDDRNEEGLFYVVNLENGERGYYADFECEKPIITNIFDSSPMVI